MKKNPENKFKKFIAKKKKLLGGGKIKNCNKFII